MNLYRIKNWEDHYENNRSRTVKDLAWVPIPNRHDGESYARIMNRKDAPEVFTVWILLLQVASRCHPRGTLLRNDGKPHDPESLSIKTRARKEWFESSLPTLVEMSWLEQLTAERQEAVSLMSSSCQSPDEERRKEGIYGFDTFWELYPNASEKNVCKRLWKDLKMDKKTADGVLAILREHVKSKKWKDGYIISSRKWIEGHCWEDKILTIQSDKPYSPPI